MTDHDILIEHNKTPKHDEINEKVGYPPLVVLPKQSVEYRRHMSIKKE